MNEDYQRIRKLVDKEISELENQLSKLIVDYSPLHTKIKNFLMTPSKRIRSVLSFLYLKALGVKVDDTQIKIQLIVELIHNASLIHDDVIDNAKIRRSKPSLNDDFDNRLAVIGGDYILSITLKNLTELNNPEITKIFAYVIENMTLGEIEQYFSRFKITDIDKYTEKSYKKTGVLFEAGLKSALISAKLPTDGSKFAKNFGIAFQIKDDLSDIENLDKTKESKDIQDGVYNSCVIYSGDAENPLKGVEKTRYLLNNYIEKAKAEVDLPQNDYAKALIDLTELLRDE